MFKIVSLNRYNYFMYRIVQRKSNSGAQHIFQMCVLNMTPNILLQKYQYTARIFKKTKTNSVCSVFCIVSVNEQCIHV